MSLFQTTHSCEVGLRAINSVFPKKSYLVTALVEMSDRHKHAWSVTYGQVVVGILLGFDSLSKPQNKYEQNGRTANQNMAGYGCTVN